MYRDSACWKRGGQGKARGEEERWRYRAEGLGEEARKMEMRKLRDEVKRIKDMYIRAENERAEETERQNREIRELRRRLERLENKERVSGGKEGIKDRVEGIEKTDKRNDIEWRKRTIIVHATGQEEEDLEAWLERKTGSKEFEVEERNGNKKWVTFRKAKVQRELARNKMTINKEGSYYFDAFMSEEDRKARFWLIARARRAKEANEKRGIEMEVTIEDRCVWIDGRRYIWEERKKDLKREDEIEEEDVVEVEYAEEDMEGIDLE